MFGACLEVVGSFERRTFYIGPLRVKLILACQEVLNWDWPSINQIKLLFIQIQPLPLNMHHKWKESIDLVYKTSDGKSQRANSRHKFLLSLKNDFIWNQMSRLLQDHVFITKRAACWNAIKLLHEKDRYFPSEISINWNLKENLQTATQMVAIVIVHVLQAYFQPQLQFVIIYAQSIVEEWIWLQLFLLLGQFMEWRQTIYRF
jgi:hypothetical protein